jgi:hypothetical protein
MNHRNERYLLGRGINAFSVILLISLLTISTSKLFSQNIVSREIADYPLGSFSSTCNSSPYTDCIISLPPAKYGESYSFTIPLKAGINRSDIIFNFSQNTACREGSISFTSDGKIEITALSSCRPAANNFIGIDLDVKNNSDGTTDKQKYYLPILRDPIKLVLVLDKSGSMALPMVGGNGVLWQLLKNAVELFVQKLEVFKQDMDIIGLTYFSSDITEPGGSIGNGFIPITADVDPSRSYLVIQSDMSTKEPSALSAIGKGLLDAKKKLNASAQIEYEKIVLLVSGGSQNVNPLVNPDGKTLSAGNVTLNDCPCNTLDSIRYYTIGMGELDHNLDLLSQIASSNGGIALTTSIGLEEDEIMSLFQEQFTNVLSGYPQIVSRKEGFLNATGITYTFPINGNVSKLYFEFINPDAAGVSIKLEKDGKDLTSLAKMVNGTYYKTINLTLPVTSPDLITSEGDWKLSLSGTSSKKYSLTCFVNDQLVDFRCNAPKAINTVGDVLQLSAKVSFAGGQILTGDKNKVEVLIIKPGDDLGDLLATYNDNSKDSLPDIESGASSKYLHLLKNNKTFYKDLLPKSQTITLSNDGSGLFTGQFKKTEISGVYQLLYIVNGEIPGFGKFERQKHYSAIFKFGQLDLGATDIRASISDPATPTADKTKMATITVKPKNKFGYYLGPGYLSTIKLSVDSRQGVVKSSKDNLDGSYTFTVVNVPPSVKPDVSIDVMGEQLYQGKFPTPKIHPWQYLVLILLVLMLFLRYIFAHIGSIWLRTIVWTMIIIWVLFMILQKFGVNIF